MTGDDLIHEAEMIMQTMDVRQSLSDLRAHLMKDVALTAMSMFNELVEAGMTQSQAHDIAKTYILDFCELEEVETYQDIVTDEDEED